MASKQSRTTSKAAFTRSLKGLRTALDTNALASSVTKKFDKVKDAWNEMQINHQAYLNTLNNDEEITAEDTWINYICDEFDKIELELDQYMDKISKDEEMNLKDQERKENEDKKQNKGRI